MINIDYIKSKIRDVPDFPKKGIVFKDITPLFLEPKIIEKIVDDVDPRTVGAAAAFYGT